MILLLWRQVSLSSKAEESLENIIKQETKGEIIYFWTRLDIDGDAYGSKNALTFWSICDILNQGNCRYSCALTVAPFMLILARKVYSCIIIELTHIFT